MSVMHEVGFNESDRQVLEKTSDELKAQSVLWARSQSWKALEEIRKGLEVGMTEEDARQLAIQVCQSLGSVKHWHRQYIRFGPQTQLTFNDPINRTYRLKMDDPVYIDIGPVWVVRSEEQSPLEVEGDVGDTFVFGNNPAAEKIAKAARELFYMARGYWNQNNCTGKDLYQFLEYHAQQRGYILKKDAHGHRISEFPHHKHTKTQVSKLDFSPKSGLWVLEVMITHPALQMGAFFEDILLSDDTKQFN